MADYVDAIIRVRVPKWQIGQEANIFFPDSMNTKGKCEEVKEGEWIIHENEPFIGYLGVKIPMFECSNPYCCGYSLQRTNYCPHCGCKIKGVSKND